VVDGVDWSVDHQVNTAAEPVALIASEEPTWRSALRPAPARSCPLRPGRASASLPSCQDRAPPMPFTFVPRLYLGT